MTYVTNNSRFNRHLLKRILKHVDRVLTTRGLILYLAQTCPLTSGQGRVSEGISYWGYERSPGGLSLIKHLFNWMNTPFHRLYEQGADVMRLVKYVNRSIKWAQSGVSLNIEKLKLKTTQILQNTFDFRVPVQSI